MLLNDRRACAAVSYLFLLYFAVGCAKDPVETWVDALRNGDVNARRIAVRKLADRDGDQVLAAIGDAIEDSDDDVRRHAIHALGRFGAAAAPHLPQLTDALQDTVLSVRLNAALSIQSIDPSSEAFHPVLNDALLRGEGGVFLSVGKMGANGSWAVPTLQKILSHPEPRFRMLAAHTLGELGPTAIDAEPSLRRALNDIDETVRDAARAALEQINTPPLSH